MRNWRFLKFITGVVLAAFLTSTVPVAALGASVAGTTQDAQTVLNNGDVLQMVAANLSEELILSQIRSSRTAFELSVPEIIRLSTNGVSDTIITAMQTAGSTPDAAEPVAEPTAEVPEVPEVPEAPSVAATSTPSRVSSPREFRKVDVFEQQSDGKEKKRDARMEFDPVAQVLTISDEKSGTSRATYVVVPYSQITKVVYERSKHRRYGSGALLFLPLMLFSGKKHWLTIEFADVADYPENYIYTRLDKNNFRQIISALEAATGLESEQYVEE